LKSHIKKPGAIIIEGHVQGLANTRALGEAGIPVIVVDKSNCIARYSKYCKGFYRCPDFQMDAFADFLVDLATRENLKGWVLIPSNDHAVYTISRFREKLSEHYKVITPELPIIENIYKKSRLLALADNIGIPIPETWYPEKPEELQNIDFHFPVMIKGREGLTFYKTTGRKVFIAENIDELLEIFAQLQEKVKVADTFIQEIIPTDKTNKTISFTAFCMDGEVKAHWTGVKLREHPPKFGTSTFSESIVNDQTEALSRRLLKALKYPGVCEVEFLLDKRTGLYKLIEINARTWLWVGLAVKSGVNYPLMIYNYMNGIEMEYPQEYVVGMKWMNRVTDFVHSVKSIIRGKMSIGDYLKSLKGKKEFAIYDPADRKPVVMFILLLPYLALKRGH
jgi:D-aspartate ligase